MSVTPQGLRKAGWLFLALGLGFAAGNYHTTDEAVKGSQDWWQGQVHKDLRGHLVAQQQEDYNLCADIVKTVQADK